MLVEPPRRLPVSSLSPSSVGLYLKCPVRWRKRYIEGLQEHISGAAILGSAIGGAERDSFSHQIATGHRLSTADVLDAFGAAWDVAVDSQGELVAWEDKPGRIKDSGARVLPLYHQMVAPTITPIALEREFVVHVPGVEWTIKGYMDVETADTIPDLKSRSRTKGPVSQEDADADLQAATYLAARRAEGNPADRFEFHNLVRTGPGGVPAPRDVLVTVTRRTDEQLDALIDLYLRVAAEIDWRLQMDVWTPPPAGAWWCSPGWCGFWADCRFGGALRPPAAAAAGPRPARPVPDSRILDAVRATARRDGTTTAAKVAGHVGISTRAAAARLAKMPAITSARPSKASGRGTARTVRELSGPRVYRMSTSEEGVTVT